MSLMGSVLRFVVMVCSHRSLLTLLRCGTPAPPRHSVSSSSVPWSKTARASLWLGLAVTTTRNLVATAAAASFLPNKAFFLGSSPGTTSTAVLTRSMTSDEVSKAQEAAAAIKAGDGPPPDVPTIFDKLLSGEIPSKVVYEDERAYCFRDVNPQAPTHILCIPKHKDGLTGLSASQEQHKELLGHLLYVSSQVAQKECPNGYRIVINDGGDGCQSVFHLHLHILGGRQMGWPPG